jgi:hypothetical protein
MTKIGDYEKIMSDRKLFNQTVYTPLSEALRLLDERRKDPELMAKVEKLLNGDIPEVLKNMECGVFTKHIATPNFDAQWFIKLTKENNLETVFFEYLDDKFTSSNNFKHSLGQIRVHTGSNKKGDFLIEKINIIDMVKHDGKKLKDIITIWKEPLIDFHRKLFKYYKLHDNLIFYDISEWYKRNGGDASEYYAKVLMLFIAHGILFENFLTKGTEGNFSKTIVLPAIENVINLTGVKPLIVPIPPMDMEDEDYWISHPFEIKNLIRGKISL